MTDVALPPISPDEKAELDNLFTYHKPFGDQPQRYELIRSKAKELAVLLIQACPRSADRTAAIRKLRECVMTANAAIAINETEPAAPADPCKCKADEPRPVGATCTFCFKVIPPVSSQEYRAPEFVPAPDAPQAAPEQPAAEPAAQP